MQLQLKPCNVIPSYNGTLIKLCAIKTVPFLLDNGERVLGEHGSHRSCTVGA
jgi:hypothetical protein